MAQYKLNFVLHILLMVGHTDGTISAESPSVVTASECYGNNLAPVCSISSQIAITAHHDGFKAASFNCPLDGTANGTCCLYDASRDCLQADLTERMYVDQFSGRDSGVLSTSMVMPNFGGTCDDTGYSAASVFSRLNYLCIPDLRISSMCTLVNTGINSLPLYIQNRNYPDGILITDKNCTCSVETLSGRSIDMYIVHMDLYDTPGNCLQTLTVMGIDGNVLRRFDCDNEEFNTIKNDTIATNYVVIELINNFATTNAGKFWIGFQGVPGADIAVNCPPKLISTIPAESSSAVTISECYDNNLAAVCSTGSQIAINSYHDGFKDASLACLVDGTATGTCCSYDASVDCLQEAPAESRYMEGFSGVDSGVISTSSLVPTSGGECDSVSYSPVSVFSQLTYLCIPDQRISSMCTSVDSETNSLPLYLQNRDYPDGILNTDMNCACSVEALSGRTIDMYIVHMDLYDTPGNCLQTLTLMDVNDNVVRTFNCDNEEFNIIRKETIATNFMVIELNNNLTTTIAGKFWIGFKGVSGADIKVNCPPKLINCSIPPSMENGNVEVTSTRFGGRTSYSCNTGYNMSLGNEDRYCGADGNWNGTLPVCTPVACKKMAASSNREESSTAREYGSIITFTCTNGFILIGSHALACHANGLWNATAPTCKKQIPALCPQNADDRETVWPQSAPGNIVMKNCSQKFSGNISRHCRDDGTWALPRYNCIRAAVQNVEKQISLLTTNATKNEVEEAVRDLRTVSKEDALTDGELETMSKLLENTVSFINEHVDEELAENTSGAVSVIVTVETFAVGYAKQLLLKNESKITISKTKIDFEITKVEGTDVVFPFISNNSERGKSNIRILEKAFKDRIVVSVGTLFRNISDILSTQSDKNDAQANRIINGPVIGISLEPPINNLSPPLEITLQHSQTGFEKPLCSFWVNKSPVGYWSTGGCRVKWTSEKVTVCECDHLTNFAVLMSPFQEADVESVALRLVSIVGISISITCLLITILVHICLWRYLSNDRVKFLMNLVAALLISYIVFLAGVDRTESKESCTVVAVLLQYIYLVVFCVMLAEGIEIVIRVMFIFAKKSRLYVLVSIAWSMPAIIVGISLGVTRAEGYGNENFCWLSIESGLIWAFVGPALLIIGCNVICLSIVMSAMFKTKSMRQKKKAEKFKTSVRSLCVLVPLMGITWVVGIFNINRDFAWIQYVFATCNGLQGVFIFLMHCLFNPQVIKAYKASLRNTSSTSLNSTLKSNDKEEKRRKNKQSSSDDFSAIENSGPERSQNTAL